MKRVLNETVLRKQNVAFAGSGGRSEENRNLGFRPAFLDFATQTLYLSRFANGRPPRQVRERQIGEDGVLNALDAGFRRDAPPGIVAEEEVGRTVDLAAQEGPAGEEERQQREKDRDPERDAGHEPAREKDGRRRRGRPGQPEREDFDFQIRRSRRRF